MVSKSEKRRLAREAKEKERESKREEEIQKILGSGHIAQTPKVTKSPKTYVGEGPRYPHQMEFSKDIEDREGSWSWGVNREWHPTPGDNHIYNFLDTYKTKTWQEIESETTPASKKSKKKYRKKHRTYSTSIICKEAQQRLIDLELDDQIEIFRFRMTNLERIYGFIFGIEFRTVWYDPTHQIYPVD